MSKKKLLAERIDLKQTFGDILICLQKLAAHKDGIKTLDSEELDNCYMNIRFGMEHAEDIIEEQLVELVD